MPKLPTLYYPPHPTSLVLQGSGSTFSPFSPALLKKAQERARETEGLLRKIYHGERPALDSGEGRGRKWVRAQIEIEAGRGLLPEHPTAYYRLTEKDPVIGYNPAPHILITEAARIEAALHMEAIRVRVLGTKRHLTENQVKPLQRNSDILIALPGDIKADLELTEVVRRKLDGAHLPPLIIENTGNAYDALLANFQLMEFNQHTNDPIARRTFLNFDGLADHYGIYITASRSETLHSAVHLYHARKQMHIPRPEAIVPLSFIADGATIFVATATRKKYREIFTIHNRQELKINILPIDILVDGYISPIEQSGSYEGNAAEKIGAAFEAWERMKPSTQVKRLTDIGRRLHAMGRRETDAALEMEEIFFISEDSGFHFMQTNPLNNFNISTEMEFADISHKIDPRVPFPGVETGPGILGNYGVSNFFSNVGKILQRYDESGYPTTTEVINKSVIALAQLQPNPGTYDAHVKEKAKKIVMYMSETRENFQTFPAPASGSLEIGNFLIPLDKKQTEAELGEEWAVSESPRALAWQALIADQAIAKDTAFAHGPLKEKDYYVAIVTDDSYQAALPSINALMKLYNSAEFHVEKLSAEITTLADVQTKMLAGKDAIILDFDPKRAREKFWRNLWIFSSLIVGEQTRDKYKLEKPLYLVNPSMQGKKPFDYLELITHDLHILGTIAQDPRTLYKTVNAAADAIELLKEDRNDYLRYDPPAYSIGPKIEAIGDESPKEFNVALFVSASNENENVLAIGSQLSAKLSKEGFGIFSGAGLYSGMGAITQAIVEIKDECDAHHTGFNVPHIMDAGEVRGKNIVKMLDRFQLCRDIYERIEGLLAADAVIVAPGGMGTIQELSGFALLKEMSLENPDAPYAKSFKTKELVILNSLIEFGGHKRGFYDVLCKAIAPGDFKKLGIHIASTPDEALAKMLDLRAKYKKTRN
jgi:predicted Rossmann-fold nucleotide-binding protein